MTIELACYYGLSLSFNPTIYIASFFAFLVLVPVLSLPLRTTNKTREEKLMNPKRIIPRNAFDRIFYSPSREKFNFNILLTSNTTIVPLFFFISFFFLVCFSSLLHEFLLLLFFILSAGFRKANKRE